MKCPHCPQGFYSKPQTCLFAKHGGNAWYVDHELCPECGRLIVTVRNMLMHANATLGTFLVVPRTVSRTALGKEVPDEFAQDYREACLVLNDSPKASAALSRRCLQHLLRDKAGVKSGNLADEIQQVLDSKQLPSHLADAVDGIRHLGNFAAHPIKSTSTGEIVDVEPGEAEWNLDTLEGLFDFYFVQPAKLKEKRDKLNQKLKDAGKQEMK